MKKIDITRSEWTAMTYYGRFEQIISWLLTLAITAVIVVAAYRLLADIVTTLVRGALDPLEHETFQTIFGAIMTLLIAMEFGHSILQVGSRSKSVVQVRTVLLVALLALSRKFIVLDLHAVSAATIVALALAVLTLGAVYWLLRDRVERANVRP
jgi:uncharacterized membrane protein (DUF373 family)